MTANGATMFNNIAGMVGQLASRFAGSSDSYGDDRREPWQSVNFMAAHDGFTQKDLYSCNNKSNSQAWPYGPSDGDEDNNNSWDQRAGQVRAPGAEDAIGGENTVYGVCGRGTLLLIAK